MKFGIVSDSSCDLSLQYARQEQVTIVSFYVSFDGEKYMKEGKEIAVTDFYQEMGFTLLSEDEEGNKTYELLLSGYQDRNQAISLREGPET